MRRFSCTGIVALLLTQISVLNVEAAVSARDWKTLNDGLLTYDDVNQRAWLDLSVSLLEHFPEPSLENAIAEVRPGGVFDGFTWALRDDVRALAQSAGIDLSTGNYATNAVATRALIDLLGVTLDRPPFVRALGFIDPTGMSEPAPPRAGANFSVSFNELTGHAGGAGLTVSAGDDFFSRQGNPTIVGLMLFRQVPEPGVLTPVLVATTWVFGLRYRFPRRAKLILN